MSKIKNKSLKLDILNMFQVNKELSSFEIKLILNLAEISTVSRKISELKNEGLVFENGKTIRKMNKPCKVYQLTDQLDIESKKKEVFLEKKNNWYKQGLKKGYFIEKTILSYEC